MLCKVTDLGGDLLLFLGITSDPRGGSKTEWMSEKWMNLATLRENTTKQLYLIDFKDNRIYLNNTFEERIDFIVM